MAGLRKSLIELSVLVAIGVVLALLGPFGSFNASFGQRLAYWVPLAVAGYLIYRPIGAAAAWAGARLHLPTAAMWVVATLIATLPMTLAVWAVSCAGRCPAPASIDAALTWYGRVLVIGGAVTLLLYLRQPGEAEPAPSSAPGAVEQPVEDDPAPRPVDQPAPVPHFMEQLPAHLGVVLVALEMEDHYLRVHTDRGSALVLMRLRDAITALDAASGMQVHRSWWVARSAIRGTRRDGRNLKLVLAGGLEAPVARERVAALRDAGWDQPSVAPDRP